MDGSQIYAIYGAKINIPYIYRIYTVYIRIHTYNNNNIRNIRSANPSHEYTHEVQIRGVSSMRSYQSSDMATQLM
jgi:uncharacterized protein (UPF0333 family)